MLTTHIHKTPAKLTSYHEGHLIGGTRSDYYTKGQTAEVVWQGRGACLLGIEGKPVTKETFERLANNLHPLTGKQLTSRNKENARSAYDLVFSMPKSLSIIAFLTGDERILEIHRRAVNEALAHIEAVTQTRVRKDGANHDQSTGNMVAALFEHQTSRENDPQGHTHAILFNATFDEVEGKWKALQAVEIFRRRKLLTEIYRSSLVKGLAKIGYTIRTTKDAFEIEGVEQEEITTFSKRKKQIDAIAVEKNGLNNPALRAEIARNSRQAKDTSLSFADLLARWKKELSPEKLAHLHSLVANANAPIKLKRANLTTAINWASQHHFERKSAVPMIDLMVSTLTYERGHFEAFKIEAAITKKTDKFLVCGNKVSTHEIYSQERELLDTLHAGIGELSPINARFQLPKGLSEEQQEVASSLLNCPDRFSVLIGPPGARKTSTLQPIVAGVHAAHSSVTLLAPSGSATETLRKDGFTNSMTMQRFLLDKEVQQAAAGGLVVLDEAGLASLEDMLSLTRIAVKQNLRVLLSGDARQCKSVQYGDAFRLLTEGDFCKVHRAELKTMSRQKHEQYLQAVTHFKEEEFAEGLAIFSKLDWINEAEEEEERYALLAKDYSEAISRGQSALVVATTWREVTPVTEQIRSSERTAGRLVGEDVLFLTLVPVDTTRAERKRSESFAVGSVLMFRNKSLLFERGEQVVVLGQMGKLLKIQRANGDVLPINPAKFATGFRVFERKEIPVAVGDSLLLRAGGQSVSGTRLINGQIAKVKAIRQGRIHLADGRILPREYQQFAHGFCITAQGSQGKTVDHMLLAVDAASATTAATQETLYVGTTRGRFSCRFYTDDREALEGAFSRSGARTSAHELISNYEQQTTPNSHPLPAARQLPILARNHYPDHTSTPGNRDRPLHGSKALLPQDQEKPLRSTEASSSNRAGRELAFAGSDRTPSW